jgi:hypothetical protein
MAKKAEFCNELALVRAEVAAYRVHEILSVFWLSDIASFKV